MTEETVERDVIMEACIEAFLTPDSGKHRHASDMILTFLKYVEKYGLEDYQLTYELVGHDLVAGKKFLEFLIRRVEGGRQ